MNSLKVIINTYINALGYTLLHILLIIFVTHYFCQGIIQVPYHPHTYHPRLKLVASLLEIGYLFP